MKRKKTTKDERITAIAKKIYKIDNPSLIERQQIERRFPFKDPEKGLTKIKFQSDEKFEFNQGSWKKYQKIEDEERKERISKAMSHINSTDYKTIYGRNFDKIAVQNRAKEVRYVKDVFELNFPELAMAINKVLGFKRYASGDVMYIYKNSGKTKNG